MNAMGIAAEKAWINLADSNQSTSSWSYQAFNPIKPTVTTPKVTTPKVTIPTVAKTTSSIKPIIQNYGSFFRSSAGDRNAYNTSVNYDKLSANQKRLADNVFNTSSTNAQKKKEEDEKKKLLVGAIDTTALVETPEQEKARLLKESTEKAKADAVEAQKAAIEAKRLENEALLAQEDTSIAELNTEQTKYTAEEETTAKWFEENRLNQVRGDIMQSLVARWVDISKLAPEQITALSGEQGVKAFADIYTAKEKSKSNIKTARDKTMVELQRLRSNKNISQNAYNTQVASINELTNTKLREAEDNYKNGVIGLIDKKVDTGTAVSTAVINTLNTLGIPLSSQSAFSNIIKNSKSVGEAYTAIMTSTDPAVQAAYKANEARIAAAAQQAFDLDKAKVNASQGSTNDKILDLVKTYQNQAINAKNTGDVQWAKDWSTKADALLRSIWMTSVPNPWTPSSGASTTASPSSLISNPFSQFIR